MPMIIRLADLSVFRFSPMSCRISLSIRCPTAITRLRLGRMGNSAHRWQKHLQQIRGLAIRNLRSPGSLAGDATRASLDPGGHLKSGCNPVCPSRTYNIDIAEPSRARFLTRRDRRRCQFLGVGVWRTTAVAADIGNGHPPRGPTGGCSLSFPIGPTRVSRRERTVSRRLRR